MLTGLILGHLGRAHDGEDDRRFLSGALGRDPETVGGSTWCVSCGGFWPRRCLTKPPAPVPGLAPCPSARSKAALEIGQSQE